MRGERLFIGLIVFGVFEYLCDAQGGYQSSNSNAGDFVTTPQLNRKPVGSQAPVTARPTFGRPWFTQGPATRPTIGRPGFTQGPATRPTIGRPGFTQGPATRPTIGRPGFTQAPVTPRPTLGGPKGSTIPVEPPTPKPDAVKAHCGESSVQLEVDMDLLGIGHLIQPTDITLGGCGPVDLDGPTQVLLFETELHSCGSVLAMTADSLVYTFTLNYQPSALGATPIIRTSSAVVGIQCHYMRLHNVSSNALKPTWIPYHSTLSAEDILVFSLRLMADKWQTERTSTVFFLGDLINIEASVVQANHVPLRVFVDTCVATLDPDMNAVPRYAFIENKGCLMDSKLTNSRSQFLSRVQDDKLQFQLDAFRFAQETRSAIYIFCHLKATAALPDSEGKACSFPLGKERWVSASGNDQACSCCDTSCAGRKGRSVDSGAQYEGGAVLGPIVIQEASKDVPESPGTLTADHRAGGSSEAVIMAAVMAAVGLACMIVLATVLVWRRYKPVL
ncbi:zona pellucida sperm-binding protein 3-like isoform X1 [Anguilla anguilla]|uniref:zona pellucida sperm-binding protein 3-like isoform X1 n=1 Tax=Anguilla anguilla TaxID=7936 RepID=UPI0015ADA496|nr:zona pellucida sperm-binding protein 3-like isoform X1 [Anguilla anguilla]